MIRLGAETLKRGKLKDNERLEIEDQILREVLLLSHLVENVLDVARIQNDSSRALAFTPVHPRDLIRTLLTTYESWIRSKGFSCSVQIDETISEQMWDRDSVSRALLNLIDNAIKYSGEIKEISVALRQDSEHIIIEVRDRGIGISAADQAKIFDPYYRAQFSDTITRRGWVWPHARAADPRFARWHGRGRIVRGRRLDVPSPVPARPRRRGRGHPALAAPVKHSKVLNGVRPH
jgi:signal transduction histidine kinase